MGYEQSIELNDGIVRIALVILLSRSDKINRIEGCGPEVLIPLSSALNREKRHVIQMLNCMRTPNDTDHRLIHTDET